MVGKLLIDEKDAFLEYWVFVEQYGYKALIQMPPFKSIDSTEWPEYDWAEYDLSKPVLDTRTFPIPFCTIDNSRHDKLFLHLSDTVYHDFVFTDLKKEYRLRLVNNSSLSFGIRIGKLTLSFADDFPSVTITEPYDLGAADVWQRGYELDEVDFSRFGIFVLNGTDDNLRKISNVRQNLIISPKTENGIIYDDGKVLYKARDVTLKLFIRSEDILTFWVRWNALFSALVKPEERVLNVRTLKKQYRCFYKSNSVSKFEILKNGHVWCEFSVTLTLSGIQNKDD